MFFTKPVFTVSCQHLAQTQSWRSTPCRLSETSYSLYSQLPFMSGGRCSIQNPRTRHALVTGTHLSWMGAVMYSGEVRVASRGQEIVSVASQGDRFKCISCVPGFQPQAYELRPAVSKELHQVHRKIGVYKMSNSWRVLTQFYCTLLYTQLYAHIQNY